MNEIMKLIDKDALVAEIERKRNDYINSFMTEQVHVLNDVLDFLDTLEVKEVNEVPANVMLNQFGNKYISSWSGLKEYDNFQVNEEIKILIPNK